MWKFSKRLEIDGAHDPAIPFLDIYTNYYSSYHRGVFLYIFLAALFTIARA